MKPRFLVSIITPSFLLLCSYHFGIAQAKNEESEWALTRSADSLEAYDKFAKSFPTSEHNEEASTQIWFILEKKFSSVADTADTIIVLPSEEGSMQSGFYFECSSWLRLPTEIASAGWDNKENILPNLWLEGTNLSSAYVKNLKLDNEVIKIESLVFIPVIAVVAFENDTLTCFSDPADPLKFLDITFASNRRFLSYLKGSGCLEFDIGADKRVYFFRPSTK